MTSIDLPKPDAPPAVALVRDFVNTTDHETGSDDLSTPAALVRHLHEAGLCTASARATAAHLREAHLLRAGLRRALELNHEGGLAALPQLQAVVRRLPVGLDWDDTGARLRITAAGVPGALAGIGLAAHRSTVDGTWARLKVCASDDCGWAYYDFSKNRSRQWCEYGCGNKIKTRAYRERQRARSD